MVVQPNFFGLMGYYYSVQLWGYAIMCKKTKQIKKRKEIAELMMPNNWPLTKLHPNIFLILVNEFLDLYFLF